MDYKTKLFFSLFYLLAAFFMSGCDTELDHKPLRILGSPPDTLYYDSVFSYSFGVAGGEGPYRYRYIQHPPNESDEDEEFEENTIEMTIEETDGAKPSFILRGIPKIPEGASFEELNDRKLRYQLELTDGKNTVTREFEFTLKKNQLGFVSEQISTEGLTYNQPISTLTKQLELGQVNICNQAKDNAYVKGIGPNGETVYPFVFQVGTHVRTASRTEIFYRIKSNYFENEPERSSRNVGHARAGVDYLDEVRSIILEPNQSICVGYVNLLDDNLVEGTEVATIEFFDSIGGAIDLSLATKTLDIRDNELKPKYTTDNIVRNRGDKVVIPITMERPVDYPISLNFSVESDDTTADSSDFLLEPESGVITLAPGDIQASYTVTLLTPQSEEVGFALEDKLISIKTDMDEILNIDPYTIEINEWADTSNISKEIVGGFDVSENVVDFAVDDDGIITTLSSRMMNGDTATILKSFNRDSSSLNFSSQGDVILSKPSQNITPISIQVSAEGTGYRLVAILNVEGLYADVLRGGQDFVVMNYFRNSGEPFQLVSAKQYGSEGNDQVEGAILRNAILYVYGNTNGADFEGVPTNETNAGGRDGFIYSISLQSGNVNWTRLIGTSDNDNVTAIDAGNRDIVASISTSSTDIDVFIRKFNTNTGQDEKDEDDLDVAITTNQDDVAAAIAFDASANNYRLLLDSDADLTSSNELTPSLSRDIQLLSFNSSNEVTNVLTFETELDDIAKSLSTTPDNESLIVSGETLGELPDNIKRGNGDIDLFTSVIELESSSNNTSLTRNIQFGTTENDSIIAVKPASDTKYFVLWKEEFSHPQNDTYRISAFSVDGKKLSRDPL